MRQDARAFSLVTLGIIFGLIWSGGCGGGGGEGGSTAGAAPNSWELTAATGNLVLSPVAFNSSSGATTIDLGTVISTGTVTASGTVTGGSLTDGTATLTSGNLTGASSVEVTGEYTYASTKTRYMSFSGDGLVPVFHSLGKMEPQNVGSSKYYIFEGGSGVEYASQRVNFPDGAIITNLVGWIYDNSTTSSALGRVTLYKQQNGLSTDTSIAEVETTVTFASTTIQELSGSCNETVNNEDFAYYIWVTGDADNADTRFYGAQITYTVTEAD